MSTSISNRVNILGNTKNHIVINGKKYDAVSGTLLDSHQPNQPVRHARTTNGGGVIDGFVRVSRGSAAQPLKPLSNFKKSATHTATGQVQPNSQRQRFARKPGIHVAPHTPQRATTLMRSAVSKPAITSPAVIKAQTRTDLLAVAPKTTVVPKMSYNSVNPVRHRRAERMMQSPAVSRYAKLSAAIPATTYKLAVPTQTSRPHQDHHSQATHSIDGLRSATSPHAPIGIHSSRALPVIKSPEHTETDIFKMALADATSHEQTYNHKLHKGKKRSRLLRLATGSLIALFLLGFLAYQNTPSLSLKIASYRSGLDAKLPASQPNGYNFGYLSYEPGNVIVNFTSPADSRQFNITQKASSWDSQALLSNFVTSANTAYETYQRAGRTVYLLSNNTATWVDSGIWYTVDGNSSLSSAQMLELAGSM